jgi:phosphate acyltransferase
MERPITLAVDAMGGYFAPTEVVAAVAEASLKSVGKQPVYFILVGDEGLLSEALFELDHNSERIGVCHASSVIAMHEGARTAIDEKPDSSIAVACRLVASGEADAVVTAGHPGAAVLTSLKYFKLLEGIHKAALASVYPTPRVRGAKEDPFSLILDVGATLRAEPQDLVAFAVMGSAYSRIMSKNPSPRVALLSNSREGTIGPREIVEAYKLLSSHKSVNFYGNIEGHEIPRGLADVVVCEGYTGDIAIKILEGVSEAAFELARSAYNDKVAWRMGLRLLSGGIKQLKQLMDFEEYGGAPLLGLDHVVILCHPRSQRKAVGNALKVAIRSVRSKLPETISELMAEA